MDLSQGTQLHMLVIVALIIEYWCKKYDILFVLVCVFVSVKDNDNDMYNFWHESGLSILAHFIAMS